MDDSELRHHIEAVDRPWEAGLWDLAAQISASCWPSGPADRSDRMALNWVRQWRPERAAAPLPRCSCAAGHCAVCN